ncbi:unnamed protein product [Notodromas monacha]|uniref:U6 small nuclear RNA (adenine-(43)-N(6))-methyltransferase n=1 Tax=Notodromas monacha TaxID=399045 RepID=A0A7R9BTG0_9CRUS|nr:unnamed protein product [Notodromas monacha]CAG0920047.1 unnamed protein product [Notodromas monacha]
MSLNKFMHERNPYKNGVDFKALAAAFPAFRDVVTSDLKGNLKLDFKSAEALQVLTKCCLLKDFQLDVDIPADRLVPVLPLRLNYLLWLEDLLDLAGLKSSNENLVGADVGTGASCVFPLLGARAFGWNFVATEIDPDSVLCAVKNVARNRLEDSIKVVLVKREESIFEPVLNALGNGRVVHFTMCNPPFFEDKAGSIKPLWLERKEMRRLALGNPRSEPKNADTGMEIEKTTSGGEVDFIARMFEESRSLGGQIKIFTSMVGTKAHLVQLKKILLAGQPKAFVETQFCQGNTMRWGLAWSFCDGLNNAQASGNLGLQTKSLSCKKPERSPHPQSKHPLPPWFVPDERDFGGNVNKVAGLVERFLAEIEVNCSVHSSGPGWKSLDITSSTGKFPHVRQLRRARARQQRALEEPPCAKRRRLSETEPAAQVEMEAMDEAEIVARTRLFFTAVGEEQQQQCGNHRVQVRCSTGQTDGSARDEFSVTLFQVVQNLLRGVYDND